MITSRRIIAILILLTFFAVDLYAGGPWALKAGKARLTFGYSRKTAGTRWIEKQVEKNHDSTLVNGLFHDFRYGYITGEIGIIDNLELSGTINYLWGYERVDGNPSVPGTQPVWEINEGFTDSWLNLKYQFLEGEYPMAAMISTRFPDLYDEPSHVYSRLATKNYTVPVDTVINGEQKTVSKTKSVTEPTSEWRGLLKRDLGVHLLAGHSFGADGYVQAMLGYNFREDAYADQLMFSIDGGYNIEVAKDWIVTPKVLFDYTGGVGNGAIPDSTDRFQFRVPGTGEPRKNYYFNNGRYGRLYGSAAVTFLEKYTFDVGVGRWIFGDGSAIYWETYGQLTYAF